MLNPKEEMVTVPRKIVDLVPTLFEENKQLRTENEDLREELFAAEGAIEMMEEFLEEALKEEKEEQDVLKKYTIAFS